MTVMTEAGFDTVFADTLAMDARSDPYSIYRRLIGHPVARQSNGAWVISGCEEVSALLHDPRLSVDVTKYGEKMLDHANRSLIQRDAPDHECLRGAVMEHFTADLVRTIGDTIAEMTAELVDNLAAQGRSRIDIVDDVAYPLPVTVICRVLGVPQEDEAQFHEWADAVVLAADGLSGLPDETQAKIAVAVEHLHDYLGELVDRHRADPGTDVLSGLVADGGEHPPMEREAAISTAQLLLVAGHETTVNLMANGMLTLLRQPEMLQRLRDDPELVVPMTEELLRYEPSVHFRNRAALANIPIGGYVIPAGSQVVLLLAAASRDPRVVDNPDDFIPDREPNQHFGFGGGVHYCIGAPLARMEVHEGLNALARRLVNPRLVADPPEYRPGAALRGPLHLYVDVDGIAER